MTMAPARAAPVSGATVYPTLALVELLAPKLMVIQLALLTAVQAHPVGVPTLTVPLPPAAPKV